MIAVEQVRYRYPRSRSNALDGVSLLIDDASFVVVTGDSGSGKSTLAHALVGLVPHLHGGEFEGRIDVFGQDTREVPARDLAGTIGFVAQDPAAQAVTDRVEDEVVFAMENLGVAPLLMRKRAEEVLDALDLTPLRARSMRALSGGERQRVMIASILAAQPRALVLDEPTSQLDPQSAEEILAVLHRLNSDLGLTIVLVEHRLERVVQHADRLVVMSAGAVVADGAPREVLASGATATPLSRFARSLSLEPVPLTVREGRSLAADLRARARPRTRSSAQPGEAVIDARGVHVALGRRDVVRDVDLLVREGETVAIVGRNGSGKTTLLRALVGLTPARAGRIAIAGFDPRADRVERIASRVAYLPQSAGSMLFNETVRAEIAFTLRARGAQTTPDDELRDAGLAAFADAHPRDLSAGQRLRVALLASTAGSPRVVLLDEPTHGMDARGKEDLAQGCAAWRADGRGVVLVTHDVELVARVATRVVLLADGAVVLDGPVEDVLGESQLFSSQMNKVFGDSRILTVDDAVAAVTA